MNGSKQQVLESMMEIKNQAEMSNAATKLRLEELKLQIADHELHWWRLKSVCQCFQSKLELGRLSALAVDDSYRITKCQEAIDGIKQGNNEPAIQLIGGITASLCEMARHQPDDEALKTRQTATALDHLKLQLTKLSES